MALSIHTNYSALITNTALNKSNNALATNQQRLGTGLRINSAADDAAGLQIATRLNAQSRGMSVAMRNIGDAVSMLQTAEGAFNEMTDIAQRMKDLATQAANDTNNEEDRTALAAEYNQLANEMNNIFNNTTYGGAKLFGKGVPADPLANPAVAAVPAGKFGEKISFQIGASTNEVMEVEIDFDDVTVASFDGTEKLEDHTAAQTAIGELNDLLDGIGAVRAEFGASINRLNHTSNNLANMKDNTDMAKGRIMDADFAMESANMSKNSMLMQSGISMLKQAGQMPGLVMSLLG